MAVTIDAPHARATARYQPVSPYKVRQVLDLVRGLAVDDAERVLHLCQKDAADDVLKVLIAAVANAEHNKNLIPEELFVAVAYADEGPTRKWGQPRARGRYFRIRKRTSHITLIVARYDDDELERRTQIEEQSGRGAAAVRRRRAERVRRSRQREEPAADHEHTHVHDHDDDEKLADDPTTLAGEEQEASEGEYIDVDDAIEEEEAEEAAAAEAEADTDVEAEADADADDADESEPK